MVESCGATAGLLMGFDGIAVDSYRVVDETVDINTVGMEFSFLLNQIRKAAELLEIGAIEEVAIRSATLTIVIRVLSPEYFVALALAPSGNYGKGRYLLRVETPALRAELS